MNEIYFIRHGESEANVLDLLCGSGWDVQLSDLGHKQMKNVSHKAKAMVFDHVIVSPLKRARQSAHYIQERVDIWHELREQNYGLWEKRPFSEVKDKFLLGVNAPEGESHEEFLSRIKLAYKKMNELEGKVLVVGHGGVGSELLKLAQNQKHFINNAQIVKIQ